jgi:hypothetical protein
MPEYIDGDTLYISKINYTVQKIVGNYSANVSIASGSLENVSSMFSQCKQLSRVSVSLSGNNIKSFSNMFSGCEALTYVDLPVNINDANVAGMFSDCKSLKNVSLGAVTLQNTIAANSLFNKVNSISSYRFADGWSVNIDKYIYPINDRCYYPLIIYEPGTQSVLEYIYYLKDMPEWYKKYAAKIQAVEDFLLLRSTPDYDLYANIISGYKEEMNGKYILDTVIGFVGNLIDSQDDTGALKFIKDTYEDISTVWDVSKLSNVVTAKKDFESCGEAFEALKDLIDYVETTYDNADEVSEKLLEHTAKYKNDTEQ